MKNLSYIESIEFATDALSKGRAFLTSGKDAPNTMTIGWGSIGYMWNRPVFIAVVRPQRHTHGIMLKESEFTVSIPTKNDLSAALAFAGTASGRDGNKFEGHGITASPSQHVSCPIIKECGLHFECKTRLIQDMTGDRMDESVIARSYPARDFHTIFIGEIVSCYTTDE